MSRGKISTAARCLVLTAVLAMLPVSNVALADDAQSAAADVARQFLSAFEKKDWATVRSLFAPNAVVSTVNLAREGQPQTSQVTAEQWLAQIEKELAPVTSIKLELLGITTLSFDQGVNVSARFRATGKAGEASFTNNGIDTYSLVQVDEDWKILRYGTFELLEFH